MGDRVAGKIALVTGIAGGMGKGCALRLAREGAKVFGCDINAEGAAQTGDEAAAQGLDLTVLAPFDLTREEDAQAVADAAGRHAGRIDILVNAAAIPPHMARGAAMDYRSQFVPTMQGEVDLVFLLCKAAWPYMEASGAASIINFASVSAFRASPVFGMTAHTAGKAAVLGMTRQLALEGAPRIRVNSVSPGMTVTPATVLAGAHEEENRRKLLARYPMQRFGTPDDIAAAVLFLASDEASWITGVNLPVEGGTLIA